ncbi:MAG: cytochrome C biogenesis protein [Bdellovibrionales bacterium CG10_big_fil_rev_8_21_14_0_10_45_34]|nr:MAG: cytochrome C biogenesis protein [Bdellovibrionales bacterium CG10_big_fil_rev_8_21_14_0_10_45_34]
MTDFSNMVRSLKTIFGKKTVAAYIGLSLLFTCSLTCAQDFSAIGQIPLQDGGRIKPFDSFAREALRLIYGKDTYNSKSANEVVLTWHFVPEHWSQVEMFKINNKPLKARLELNEDKSLFTLSEVMQKSSIWLSLVSDVQAKRQNKEKLLPFDQAVQLLDSQINLFSMVASGHALKFWPRVETEVTGSDHDEFSASQNTSWVSVAEVSKANDSSAADFSAFASAFVEAIKTGSAANLDGSVKVLISNARAINPAGYADESLIRAEVHYNQFHPFKWAWILYALAACFVLASWIFDKRGLFTFSLFFTGIAFLIHSYGFALRVFLTGRPPVSNMYESVVWVAWGAVVFGGIIALSKSAKKAQNSSKKFSTLTVLSSLIVAVVCLITADLAPSVLDPSIQPLESVLRSNLWLTVHVLTITLSYGAFFVAFVLGDIGLFHYLKGKRDHDPIIQDISRAIYRALMIGVVLLAAGTILGGVWADYSWGRFWGWDPKENWALIALLGYVAVLHGRLAGWLKTFGFIASSVVSFGLVIMAWFGVNYVLGAGLHTYGFGVGGVKEVSLFVLCHFIYVGFVAVAVKRKLLVKDSA